MKKLFWVINLLVISMLLIGCQSIAGKAIASSSSSLNYTDCKDSDGGKMPDAKGMITLYTTKGIIIGAAKDTCYNSITVKEVFCKPTSYPTSIKPVGYQNMLCGTGKVCVPDSTYGAFCVVLSNCTDVDNDGYCTQPSSSSLPPGKKGGDCNDANVAIHPGVTDICDGIDNNCDGTVDCGAGFTCRHDVCVPNGEVCGLGERSCVDGSRQSFQVCEDDDYGPNYWITAACPQGQVCSGNGVCSGAATCTVNDWDVGAWGSCNVQCGNGTQTRNVTKKVASACVGVDGKPATNQSCTLTCPTERTCQSGVCVNVNATCTPGPTGVKYCQLNNSWYSVPEYQRTDCSRYNATRIWCGSGSNPNSCLNGNCCTEQPYSGPFCEGNILVNQTQNSCTRAITRNTNDCTIITSYINGQPEVCGNVTSGPIYGQGIICAESCAPNSELITCFIGYNTHDQYICSTSGIGYIYNSSVSSCPTGTTCQNFSVSAGVCR